MIIRNAFWSFVSSFILDSTLDRNDPAYSAFEWLLRSLFSTSFEIWQLNWNYTIWIKKFDLQKAPRRWPGMYCTATSLNRLYFLLAFSVASYIIIVFYRISSKPYVVAFWKIFELFYFFVGLCELVLNFLCVSWKLKMSLFTFKFALTIG